jgi:hypothetical protein
MPRIKKPKHIKRDMIILFVSIAVGFLIYISQIVPTMNSNSPELVIIVSFLAGLFFTSAFTITPAGVVLAQLMKDTPIVEVALIGATGALVGDLIIFMFIRDSLSEDLNYMLRNVGISRYKVIMKNRIFRFITPLLGALLIASPLPDEIGLAMMGLSKVRVSVLIPLAFGMNFLGIILIGIAIS